MARLLCNRADTIPVNPPKKVNFSSKPLTITRLFCKKKTALAIFLLSCFFTPPLHAAGIIATIPPLAAVVQMLTDEPISCLLPPGSDPHHFQLSPRQVEKLNSAMLLVRSSKDDHGWMQMPANTPVIDIWPKEDHAWLNPDNLLTALPRIAGELISLFPDKKTVIEANLKRSMEEAGKVKSELRNALSTLQSSGVMMQHPSWRRVFDAYGVPVLSVLESQRHGHEHGPRHLEKALATLEKHPDAVLIGDVRHSNRSLEWLADHSKGKKILFLDALGSCGDSWATLMQQNISRISER
ncbi:MAG: zinc ABC transporter substrate-binding protein [Mariprofundaceae bacterium]|nr:zinc ABC transporter substrate-binding protein [Mariprofundaceae bacterium]